MSSPSIAVVSNDMNDLKRIRNLFKPEEFSFNLVRTLDHMMDLLNGDEFFDVILVHSQSMKDHEPSDLELIKTIRNKRPGVQIIIMAETKGMELAIQSLEAGAYQYMTLPVPDQELELVIHHAVERSPLQHVPDPIPLSKRKTKLEKLVGRSLLMQEVYRMIGIAAGCDIPVLLWGETGTGKDLAAQAIHQQSQCKKQPFIPVHLGSLPSELIASELFGYEKGAFTGAVESKPGKFEQAEGGTIFLDEIGTIDEKVQVSLLRLIEQKKYMRLGGQKSKTATARIVAATNLDIESAVNQGKFREDLYYRLNVFQIKLPPLRTRYGDIPILAKAFLNRFSKSFKKNVKEIDPDCMRLLEAYEWPGNVRQLNNTIQRAVLMSEGKVLSCDHLPTNFTPRKVENPKIYFELGTPLDEVEKELLTWVLESTNDNRTQAAELLGISRRSLYSKLEKYNLK